MRTDPCRLAAVAVGGVLGSWLRWWVSTTWPNRSDAFPTTTLAINLLGAAALGLVIAALLERRPVRPVAHALVGTGLLGAFTTFATMAVEAVVLVDAGQLARAGTYLALSLVLGVIAVSGSLALGRRWWVRR